MIFLLVVSFRQRLGDEVLENLIEPLMGGIYGTDIDQLSLMSTFPNFKEKEEQFGSLIKGMKDEKEQRIKNVNYIQVLLKDNSNSLDMD